MATTFILPISFVVFDVSHHSQNKNLMRLKKYASDQSILVAADIEDGAVAN
jgi:hypothetical protein